MEQTPPTAVAQQLGLQAPEPLELEAPKAVANVESAPQAVDMVKLTPEVIEKVDTQVDRFVSTMLGADFQSDEFKASLDSGFRLGRKEIADSASLTGRFMEKNFVGQTDEPAFKVISQLRDLYVDLNPARQGDLLSPNKILGFIPFGNKLKAYFQRFESAGGQIKKLLDELRSAEDDIRKDAIELQQVEARLWEAMQKLRAAIHFAEKLDGRLASEVENLKASDPIKARALEQEVLFYARQNLTDMQTQQVINVNTYLSVGALKKVARDLMIGCDRMATHGMSALANAVIVAKATGNQIRVQEMLDASGKAISDLIVGTSQALGTHVNKVGEFASNPLVAIDALKQSMDNTIGAIDALEGFRSKALATMATNNQAIKGMLDKSGDYLERQRKAQASLTKVEQGSNDIVAL